MLAGSPADRLAAAHRFDGPVVGVVGGDVPAELVTASGALPVRLASSPGVDREEGDRYLGTGVDPAARALLAALLGGRWPGLDAIVVGRDCEASSRLFFALRELHRIGLAGELPPVLLCDVLHLPHRSTTRYTVRRLDELRARLGELLGTAGGRTASDDDLATACAAHDEQRDLLAQLTARRRAAGLHPPSGATAAPGAAGSSGPPGAPGPSGSEVLAVHAALTAMPVDEGTAELRRLLDSEPPPPIGTRVRVHLTGSSHDEPSVYRALENSGYLVVSDDHDWGDLRTRGRVGAPGDVTALAEYYQSARPTAARSAPRERAALLDADLTESRPDLVLAYRREQDDAPAWDLLAQRAVCDRHGIPLIVLDHQPYGAIDLAHLDRTRLDRAPTDRAPTDRARAGRPPADAEEAPCPTPA